MIRLTCSTFLAFATASCITPPPMDNPTSRPVEQPTHGDTASNTPPAQADPAPLRRVAPPPEYVEPAPRPFATEAGLVFGRDSAWIQSRTNVGRNSLVDAGIYFSDDETIFDIGILQIGQPNPESPLAVGAGVSFYGGTLRDPFDSFSAIALSGIVKYRIDSAFPGTALAEISYAPEATAFGDSDSLIDLLVSFEIEIASTAAILVGYRWFEVGITDNFDLELQDSAIVGVRLGF